MSKIPIIDENDLNSLIEEALKSNGTLVTPTEVSQMLINIPGICICSNPRPDGRWQGYILNNNKRTFVYGKTKEEVAVKLKEMYKYGIPKPRRKPKSPALSEWVSKWITLYKEPNVKPKTLEIIKASLKGLLQNLGDTPLSLLNTDSIQAYLLSMKGDRIRQMCLTNLNQALEKARKQGVIKTNPCDAVEIKKHVYTHKNALTPEEQNALLAVVKDTDMASLFNLLLTTGIRIGEALALTIKDVDYKNKLININKNVVFIDGQRIVQTPKTQAGTRTIPIPENVLKILPQTEILFPLTYNSVRLIFSRLSKKTNIYVTPHILRHTYATRLEELGIPPKIKQYLLGHSSIQTTENIYTDVQQHYIDNYFDKINSMF